MRGPAVVENSVGKHHGVTIVRQSNVFGIERKPRSAQIRQDDLAEAASAENLQVFRAASQGQYRLAGVNSADSQMAADYAQQAGLILGRALDGVFRDREINCFRHLDPSLADSAGEIS